MGSYLNPGNDGFRAIRNSDYVDKSCDSRQLFEDLEIAAYATFEKYPNQYDVIYLDITWFISTAHDIGNVVNDLQNSVVRELKETFPDIARDEETSLPRVMSAIAQRTGKKFIVIIDEWDGLFREAKYDAKRYRRIKRGVKDAFSCDIGWKMSDCGEDIPAAGMDRKTDLSLAYEKQRGIVECY